MEKTANRIKNIRFRLFFCLLPAMVFLARLSITGYCDNGKWPTNSSGNPNREACVDPIGRLEGYSAVLYDGRNGMPSSEANAIAQTKDGFIWIGSYAGLIRYDGSTFERIGAKTGIASVRCLYVDSLGRLWIGTNDSGVFLMEAGKETFQKWDYEDGLGSVSIRAITEDDQGAVYIASASDIAVIDTGLKLHVLADDRIAGQSIRDIRQGSEGLIYGLTGEGDLFSAADGSIIDFLGHEESPVKGSKAIFPGRTSGIFRRLIMWKTSRSSAVNCGSVPGTGSGSWKRKNSIC